MSKQNDTILLKSFNRRNPNAFSIVYRMIYRELYLYATRLFDPLNLPAEDVIQDIFTDIWLRESVQFPSILYIKTFCFIALKNAYKNKIKHQGYQQRFELECKVEKEFTDDIEQWNYTIPCTNRSNSYPSITPRSSACTSKAGNPKRSPRSWASPSKQSTINAGRRLLFYGNI